MKLHVFAHGKHLPGHRHAMGIVMRRPRSKNHEIMTKSLLQSDCNRISFAPSLYVLRRITHSGR